MSPVVISVENLSKVYRLGQIGTGTLTNDLRVWWATKGLPRNKSALSTLPPDCKSGDGGGM